MKRTMLIALLALILPHLDADGPATTNTLQAQKNFKMDDGQLATLINVHIVNGETAKLRSLLDRGVNPDPIEEDGKSLSTVNLAVSCNQPEMLEMLLIHGANPNPSHQPGGTPLTRAVGADYTKCVQVLLEHGADPLLVSNGVTPLALAKYKYDRGMDKDIYPIFVKAMKSSDAQPKP